MIRSISSLSLIAYLPRDMVASSAATRQGRAMRALVLILLLGATPAFAATRGCAPYDLAIGLDFQTLRPEVRTNVSLNTTGIRDLVRGKSMHGLDAHTEPLGVTLTTPSFSVDGRTRIETLNGV